jgi:hypothetical protein
MFKEGEIALRRRLRSSEWAMFLGPIRKRGMVWPCHKAGGGIEVRAELCKEARLWRVSRRSGTPHVYRYRADV